MALVRFALPPEIDLFNCPEVRHRLMRESDTADAVVVDCGAVDYIDSKGMAMLVEISETFSARGVHLVLSRPSRAMRIWLSVTGLTDHFCVRQP